MRLIKCSACDWNKLFREISPHCIQQKEFSEKKFGEVIVQIESDPDLIRG